MAFKQTKNIKPSNIIQKENDFKTMMKNKGEKKNQKRGEREEEKQSMHQKVSKHANECLICLRIFEFAHDARWVSNWIHMVSQHKILNTSHVSRCLNWRSRMMSVRV